MIGLYDDSHAFIDGLDLLLYVIIHHPHLLLHLECSLVAPTSCQTPGEQFKDALSAVQKACSSNRAARGMVALDDG